MFTTTPVMAAADCNFSVYVVSKSVDHASFATAKVHGTRQQGTGKAQALKSYLLPACSSAPAGSLRAKSAFDHRPRLVIHTPYLHLMLVGAAATLFQHRAVIILHMEELPALAR